MGFLELGGQRLEYTWLRVAAETAPTLVFLHEGLGSVALWKDFPRQLAHASGCNALVYSRQGYGRSSPLTRPREPDFMHVEALEVLPALLDALGVHEPILFGHSDGASIALIHAGSGLRPVRGAILLAPHVMVEELCLHSIAAARADQAGSDLGTRLAPYHADPEGAFRG